MVEENHRRNFSEMVGKPAPFVLGLREMEVGGCSSFEPQVGEPVDLAFLLSH